MTGKSGRLVSPRNTILIREAQGYCFGHPLPAGDFEQAWLRPSGDGGGLV
jgi:hypothetical protein